MKKYMLMLVMLASTLAAMAQEKKDTVIITLRNGTEVRYTSDEFDRVQIIYNLKYGVKVYLKDGKSKDYLAEKVVVAEYHNGDSVVADLNTNRNLYRAKLLEYPHLAADSTMNQLIIKSTEEFGITFSLEWSYADKANRWTCYQMHAGNTVKNVTRKDAFREDPEIPPQYRSKLSDYSNSGFSRGHLCPSADRLCSQVQNSQTFFLSNMQPQHQNHNNGLWARLEDMIRVWADNCDTLYVVKAATIRSDQLLDEKCNNSLIVPKYFYMAVLAYNKSFNTYEAMGLWTEHSSKTDSNKNLGDYAITIDALEERTGIDFFCNLPDAIEDDKERKINLNYWGITKTN
jgi:endonuclease G